MHWGYLDGGLEPVLTVDSGDRVIDRMRHRAIPSGCRRNRPVSTSCPRLKDIHQKVKRGTGNHIFTGPVYVRGAAIGDVLEVKILDIELRQNWGYNLFRGLYGARFRRTFPITGSFTLPLDQKSQHGASLSSGLKIPMRPFFGQLAVAPPQGLRTAEQQGAARVRRQSRLQGADGGQHHLSAGVERRRRCSRPATAMPPRATERSTAPRSRPRSRARSNSTCARILAGRCRVRKPPTHYITFGLDTDLDDAARQALREMIDWIISADRHFQGRSLFA